MHLFNDPTVRSKQGSGTERATLNLPTLRKYFQESTVIPVHTTLYSADNITTVPSDLLWLWFFRYWSAIAARQKADYWASHLIGLLYSLHRHVICRLVFGSQKRVAAKLLPRPHPNTHSGRQRSGQTPTRFLLWKWSLTVAWLMAFPLPKIYKELKKKKKRPDSCITQVEKVDMHPGFSQQSCCVERPGGRAVSHCMARYNSLLTSPVRWGWHARNKIRSDHILRSQLSLSQSFSRLFFLFLLYVIIRLCQTSRCKIFLFFFFFKSNCEGPDRSTCTILACEGIAHQGRVELFVWMIFVYWVYVDDIIPNLNCRNSWTWHSLP